MTEPSNGGQALQSVPRHPAVEADSELSSLVLVVILGQRKGDPNDVTKLGTTAQ